MKKLSLKTRSFAELIIILAGIIVINLLASLAFLRIDLTSENRYTLSGATKKILRNLDDVVFIRVYLDGELPVDLVRFRDDIKQSLLEFRAYAGKNLEFEFVNLYEEPDTETRNNMMRELAEQGLRVTDVQIRDEQGGLSSKTIFPGAIVSYRDISFPVNLLKNNPALPYHENLANSVESLEYEFIRVIKSITSDKVEKVAFIEGHGELDYYETFDISSELSLFFQVDRGVLGGNLANVLDYRALIIAKPETKFSEADKFVLDQYLMNGGNLLFFLDPVQANEDSLISGHTYTSFRDLNTYDLLFKYGIRISYNLVKDLQSNFKRIQTSINNQEPQTRILPWWYSPLVSPSRDNLLTRGLNYIKTDFVSAIDTTLTALPGIKRTILLTSSDTAALIENPVYISLSEVVQPPDRRIFNRSALPLAILAEGRFPSYFRNYAIPEGVSGLTVAVLDESEPASVFVAGDGDMIRNDVLVRNGEIFPQALGYDRDTRQTFGNREFIMNVVNYMTGDRDLISLRAREFKLRLLDRTKIRSSSLRTKWILINSLLPVIIVILAAAGYNQVRKRKFGRRDDDG